MKPKGITSIPLVALAIAALTFSLVMCAQAQGQTETAIFIFPGAYAGNYPYGKLIRDSAGNLYGTSQYGGNCCGTVFKLSPTSGGGWQETVLHGFSNGTYGAYPSPGLVQDAAGNLYGETLYGGDLSGSCYGTIGCGVIFELSPTASGPWTQTILHKFTGGKDGGEPNGGLTIDAAGNLYGTTFVGGDNTVCIVKYYGNGCGVVFKLSHAAVGGWRETVLRTFTKGPDGEYPNRGLALDAAGSVYGTTTLGGSSLQGIAFELTPNSGGEWTEHVLHTFFNEGSPMVGMSFDAAGNLYGSTVEYGGQCPTSGACGNVFELSPTSTGTWNEAILHTFSGSSNGDGSYPYDLTLDASGNVYGTTEMGGLFSQTACFNFDGCGIVYKLTPASGTWNETILYKFSGNPDGIEPLSGVVLDPAGNIFGVTPYGGTTTTCGAGCGVVFEVTP